jgi:hypothetical protein
VVQTAEDVGYSLCDYFYNEGRSPARVEVSVGTVDVGSVT